MASPELEQTNIIQDGYILNPDTGEILGLASTPKADFAVVDVPTAEWVLEKMLQAQAAAEALESTPEVIFARAVLANIEKLKKPHLQKIDYLKKFFGDAIIEVAKNNLPKKGKTWQSAFGSVAFRKTGAKLDIGDEEKAAKWLAANYPESIRLVADLDQLTPDDRAFLASLAEEGNGAVKSQIMKEKLPAELLIKAANTKDFETDTGIAYVAERESATLKVGG